MSAASIGDKGLTICLKPRLDCGECGVRARQNDEVLALALPLKKASEGMDDAGRRLCVLGFG